MSDINIAFLLITILLVIGCVNHRYEYNPEYQNRGYLFGSYDDNTYIGQGIAAKIHQVTESSYWKNIYTGYRNKYNISREWTFKTSHVHINGDGDINIKGAGQFGFNTFIEIPAGSTLNIGHNVQMSKNVVIYGGRYDNKLYSETGKIVVNDCVTNIGDNVFIYPFVHIDGCVDIPNGTIVFPHTYVR